MKLAFVLPWYDSKGIPGGAESEALHTIRHLAQAGYPVDVFTTCIQDFFGDWSTNSRPAGTTQEGGITVHRYPVLPRDKATFDQANQKIIGRMSLTPQEAIDFADQFIRCPGLLNALHQNRDRYLFFFIPYLFPTTFDGLSVVGRNSVLVPCFHEEGYAYLDLFQQVVPKAQAIIYHTHSEYRLAQRLYPQPKGQIHAVLGGGVNLLSEHEQSADHNAASAKSFRRKYSIDSRFVLYAGRKDAGKNLRQLINYWRYYQRESGRFTQLKLVFIGPGQAHIPPDLADTVYDLGYVSAADKRAAFAEASLFCQPSLKESFSLVLMDAWLAEKPVLVNGLSNVLVEHVRRSNGGLYYGNHSEFVAMIDWLLDHPEESDTMGRNGRMYVEQNYTWSHVIDSYIDLIDQIAEKNQLQIERGLDQRKK